MGVVSVSPGPYGIVRETTRINLRTTPVSAEELAVPRVTYEDIGELHDAIQKIREMVELPLKHPKLFNRLYQRFHREFLAIARRVEKAKLEYRKVEVADKVGPFKRIRDKLKFMKKKEPSRDEILFKYIKDKADLIIKHVKESEKHSKDIEESLPLIEDERIKRKALRYVRRSSYEAAKALNEMIKKVKKYDVEIDESGLDIYLLEEGYEEYLE